MTIPVTVPASPACAADVTGRNYKPQEEDLFPVTRRPRSRTNPGVAHAEHGLRKEIEKVDAVATAPETAFKSFAHLDEKILRKMDIRLIPMLAALYLLSFLDRGNIGNAKIECLQEDLGMTPGEYNLCLTAFFFA
ncbi:hypothetical protein DL771_002263 [Monosporascus sp. 5C6A]|nr:hypothetical protein DL771_002263 [Monosporascus sp. 5C6A]